MKTSEVLNQAADDICMFGHHKGSAYDVPLGSGRQTAAACVMGAVGRTASNLAGADDVAAENGWCAALSVLAAHVGIGVDQLPHWNDDLGTTAEQVVEVMRTAALIESVAERESEQAHV